ncbi:MAG: hypothetical protein GXX96_22535 [Planctomycetaceae bacterium]|nr:hypothetical protein [Planctomycetaceae bacterium]
MARRLAVIVFMLTLFAAVPRAQAQFTWFHVACDSVVTDFKRNNCWPEPFLGPDRLAVRAPFNVMVQNGWQLQNTVSDHYFDETTGKLTAAGENKVYWILTQAPKQHRTIYVQMSRNPEVTVQRLQTVQAVAQNYALPGTVAQVEATVTEPPGWTAERVGLVNQAFEASAPPPRLSSTSSSGSGT